jgi:chromate transporter
VVAQAVLGMAKSLTPDARRATIAVAVLIATLFLQNSAVQVAAIVVAGLAGLLWLRTSVADERPREEAPFTARVPRPVAILCLIVFAVLLGALPLAAATGNGAIRLASVFYRAGALVFGGGHVVLPLLQAQTVPSGLVSHTDFLAGYGAAQAVPGPLFTFAAFLGTVASTPPNGVIGAAIALLAIFLPAALLLVGALPFWEGLRRSPAAQRALQGVNAGVVGLLASALYTPVFTAGITSSAALAIAAAAFVALTKWQAPPWAVVILAGVAGFLLL